MFYDLEIRQRKLSAKLSVFIIYFCTIIVY